MSIALTDAGGVAPQASRSPYWGYQQILDCRGGDVKAVRDRRPLLEKVKAMAQNHE